MISSPLLVLLVVLVGLKEQVTGLVPPALPRQPATCRAGLDCVSLWFSSDKPIISDDDDDSKEPANYRKKLEELDETIAKAEKERQQLLLSELERYERKAGRNGKEKENEDDKKEEPSNLVPVEEWTPRELRKPPSPGTFAPTTPTSAETRQTTRTRTRRTMTTTRSKVTRSDAGTLVIEITPQGITSGVLFNGAFSVAWFSAIVPATFAALSGAGLLTGLFLLPFWAAGGMVAKQAVVDPFVSNKLSIGQYAWSVESRYAKSQIQKKEGSTDDLQGAKLEVPVVVNGVPQYQLCLYGSYIFGTWTTTRRTSKGG